MYVERGGDCSATWLIRSRSDMKGKALKRSCMTKTDFTTYKIEL